MRYYRSEERCILVIETVQRCERDIIMVIKVSIFIIEKVNKCVSDIIMVIKVSILIDMKET